MLKMQKKIPDQYSFVHLGTTQSKQCESTNHSNLIKPSRQVGISVMKVVEHPQKIF